MGEESLFPAGTITVTPEELEKLVADIVAKQKLSLKEVVPQDLPEAKVGKVVTPKKFWSRSEICCIVLYFLHLIVVCLLCPMVLLLLVGNGDLMRLIGVLNRCMRVRVSGRFLRV